MPRIFQNFVYDDSINVYKEALETAEKAGIMFSGMSIVPNEPFLCLPGLAVVRLEFYSAPELKLFERAYKRQQGQRSVGLFISNFDEHFVLDGNAEEYGITEAIYCDGSNGNPEGHIVYFNDDAAMVDFMATHC